MATSKMGYLLLMSPLYEDLQNSAGVVTELRRASGICIRGRGAARRGRGRCGRQDPLIRDAIIRLIGSKNADQVKSLTNREELRKECETTVNELLVKETGKKAVRELIFTKFLYQ